MPTCTTGTVDIAIDPMLVTVVDPTGFTVGATIVFSNAVGAGQDLITTIVAISGTQITLLDGASATVTDDFCLVSSSGTWFGPSGACGCDCGEVACLVCASDTPGTNFSISIAGLVAGSSCAGCTVRDGTFVLTNAVASTCVWSRSWGASENYNCELFDPADFIYIGSGGTLLCFGRGPFFESISLEITGRTATGFDVVVTISNIYVSQTQPVYATRWTSVFSGHVATCAALAGYVVPFSSSSAEELIVLPGSGCVPSTSSVGDFCGFDGATITLVG